MQTKNVYYAEQPDDVIITANGDAATIEFPVDVTEVETEEGTQYMAETVYSITTKNTPDMQARINNNLEEWFERAKKPEPQKTELADVVDAINVLTEILIGGE